jgi:hypothetical protein
MSAEQNLVAGINEIGLTRSRRFAGLSVNVVKTKQLARKSGSRSSLDS